MRTRISILLGGLLFVGACKGVPVVPPKSQTRATRSEAPASPVASSLPASVAPAGPVLEASKLVQPKDTSVLSGVVQIDASYIVAQGGGNIVAQGGGNIVAQGGGNIVAQGGGNIVAQGGGNFAGNNGSTIVASGGGNIVAQGGGNAITVGGQIVAQGGGNIVAQGGGNVVAAGGGNIVSAVGGGFIGHNGSAIVAQGGGNIVAQGGGNIVAQGGGNIVAQGGGNAVTRTYRLAAASPAAGLVVEKTAPPYGAILPAAGMVVWLRDLTTGAAVPIGQDKAGKPVYCVYSNLAGQYEIYVPASEKNNVLVVAEVPFKHDDRMGYTLLDSGADGRNKPIDEDTALVTKYLRSTFKAKFKNVLSLLAEARGGPNDPFLHPEAIITFFRGDSTKQVSAGGEEAALEAIFVPMLTRLLRDIQANCTITPDDYEDLAQALGDEVIANCPEPETIPVLSVAFDGVANRIPNNPYFLQRNDLDASGNPKLRVLDVMREIMARVRQRMTRLGEGKTPDQVASLFASRPYIQFANDVYARRHPTEPAPHYRIEKPADLMDFLVAEYFPLVAGNHYGCDGGDCPSPLPTPGFTDGSASGTACSLAEDCIQFGPIADVTNYDIVALSATVIRDLNTLARKPSDDPDLDPGDVEVIYAAASSLGFTLGQVITGELKDSRNCLPGVNPDDAGGCQVMTVLEQLVRNYKGRGACPSGASAAARPAS